jgi:hypothetical protein
LYRYTPEQRRAPSDVKKTMMGGVNFHEIHTKRDSSAPTTGAYNATLPAHPATVGLAHFSRARRALSLGGT